MGIKISLTCSVAVQGDGSSTSFTFDLLKVPFTSFSQPSGNIGLGNLVLPAFGAPTGVTSDSATNHGTTISSISVSGTQVTVVFGSAPSASFAEVFAFYLAF